MNSNIVPGLISILIPTRERPENVIRLVNSVLSTASESRLVEIIFYVDDDDKSFPNQVFELGSIKVITGPRMWLSLIQNILFIHASGEIIMYSGDDVLFESNSWDKRVRKEFNSVSDKILLVYGSDGGHHGERIAIHGFVHREWINTIGCYLQPGRVSSPDLWLTETARKIGRLRYIEELKFTHIHFRQGDKAAKFDNTYKSTSDSHFSFRPLDEYKKMDKERRIDRILLLEKMTEKPNPEFSYLLSETFIKLYSSKLDLKLIRRIKALKNISFILYLIKRLFKSIFRIN